MYYFFLSFFFIQFYDVLEVWVLLKNSLQRTIFEYHQGAKSFWIYILHAEKIYKMTSEVVRHHLFRFKMVAKPKSLRCYRDPYLLVPFSICTKIAVSTTSTKICSWWFKWLSLKLQSATSTEWKRQIHLSHSKPLIALYSS